MTTHSSGGEAVAAGANETPASRKLKDVNIYTIYLDPQRGQRLRERFAKAGVPFQRVTAATPGDPRIPSGTPEPRTHAIMLSHLDMIRQFLSSSAAYGVFCEDDVHIRRDFATMLERAVAGYERLGLDVLLLGYLLNYLPATISIDERHRALEAPVVFLSSYPRLWGAQMYLLGREAARKILDAFGDCAKVKVFSSDWTITHFGKSAVIYPMLAVEEGEIDSKDPHQTTFHKRCTALHYNPEDYF